MMDPNSISTWKITKLNDIFRRRIEENYKFQLQNVFQQKLLYLFIDIFSIGRRLKFKVLL